MNSPAQEAQAFVGIDVSKATLDACLLTATVARQKSFANAEAGYAQLMAWAQTQAPGLVCHFALEVTASYSQGLALSLAGKGERVSLLNPARVHHAALSRGTGNKTDKADALVIADFCRKEGPPL